MYDVDALIKELSPGEYYRVKALHIKELVNGLTESLPNLDKYKTEFRTQLGLNKQYKFPRNVYGLAKKFWLIRFLFMKLYAVKSLEVPELKIIRDYLKHFNEYSELVHDFIVRKTNYDPLIESTTKILNDDIETFTQKYNFLISSEDDLELMMGSDNVYP